MRKITSFIAGGLLLGCICSSSLSGANALQHFHSQAVSLLMPVVSKFLSLCALFLGLQGLGVLHAVDRYVSTSGSDSNDGTFGAPWRTIQKAADTVTAGYVIHIRAGTYSERVTITNRDGTSVAPIVFQKYAGDSGAVIVTQASMTPPSNNDASALLKIQNSDYITVQGLEFADYKTAGTPDQQEAQLPSGIYIVGNGNGIKILNCKVSEIWQSCPLESFDANGFGIAVYGTSTTPINNLVIDGCEIYNLRTGASESVVLNGNVTNFAVTNNIVHDCNNIGIDLIGYETSLIDTLDRARDGVVSGNTVYNVDTAFNPAYGGNHTTGGGERSAAGIYVDGGTNIVIERNHVFRCNFGVELASEHASGFTDNITLRNNLLHHNHSAGLIMGGYDHLRGRTRFCTVTGNTLYRNGTSDSIGQIALQFYVSDCSFRNNIVWAGTSRQMWTNWVEGGTPVQREIGANVTLNYNRYFCSTGSATNLYFTVFKNGGQRDFDTLSEWKTDSNSLQQDTNSTFSNPGFATATPGTPPVSPTAQDLQNIRAQFALLASSTAIDAGDPVYTATSGERDIVGQLRVLNARVDIGAYEYGTSWQAWQETHFGAPPGANSGPQDDRDQDGVDNLLEYSQGMNPNVKDAPLMPVASRVGANVRFTYRKAAAELTYTVQQNTTLSGTWTTLSTTESFGSGQYWREVPLNGPARFFRLVVTLPDS